MFSENKKIKELEKIIEISDETIQIYKSTIDSLSKTTAEYVGLCRIYEAICQIMIQQLEKNNNLISELELEIRRLRVETN